MRPIQIAGAAAALFLFAGAAHAQDRAACGVGMVCASDPDSVARAMEKAGLKPKKTDDNQGDPMIESAEAAYHFQVYFYGCEKAKNCDSLRFQVAFKQGADNTPELANKWNATKRFLQASVPADGRFIVSYDVPTIGGLNERNFADMLDWWKSMLGELGDFLTAELKLRP